MWKNAFELGKDIIIATTSIEGKPHAIYVTSLGFFNEKLLIGACQMVKTLENLNKNKYISIIGSHDNGYFRIDGEVSLFSSGEYFNEANERSKELSAKYFPKHTIVVDIKEVFDLDKVRRIL